MNLLIKIILLINVGVGLVILCIVIGFILMFYGL